MHQKVPLPDVGVVGVVSIKIEYFKQDVFWKLMDCGQTSVTSCATQMNSVLVHAAVTQGVFKDAPSILGIYISSIRAISQIGAPMELDEGTSCWRLLIHQQMCM